MTNKEFAILKEMSFSKMMKLWNSSKYKTFDEYINAVKEPEFHTGDVLVKKYHNSVFVVKSFNEPNGLYELEVYKGGVVNKLFDSSGDKTFHWIGNVWTINLGDEELFTKIN